MYKALRC